MGDTTIANGELRPDVLDEEPEQPLRRHQFSDGHVGWFTSKHSSCRAIMGDARFSVHPLRPLGGDDGGFQDALSGPESAGDLLRVDPPQHTRVRRLMTRYFTVRRVAALRPAIERIVEERLGAMEEAGPPVDFVRTFALPVPSMAICEVFGVPSGIRDRFEKPTEIAVDYQGTTPEEKKAAMREFYDFAWSIIEEKRARPGDDLLSEVLATGELNADELKGIVMLLFGAGFHTTATMFTVSIFFLLSERERWEAVRADLTSIDRTVEELLRYLNPVNIDMPRTALEDVEVDGVVIKAGETVAIVPARPSGDLEASPDLRRFDPVHDASGHLAFGNGRHMCLGQHLARLELRVGLEALMRRFPTLHLAGPVDSIGWHSTEGLAYSPDAFLNRDELPVSW
jgi:cytochrome P450